VVVAVDFLTTASDVTLAAPATFENEPVVSCSTLISRYL
jgi:hypothetical protein